MSLRKVLEESKNDFIDELTRFEIQQDSSYTVLIGGWFLVKKVITET